MAIRKKTLKEIELMRQAGQLAAQTLHLAGQLVKPGVSLNEINKFVHQHTIDNGAIPAPLNYHGYPKSVCLSVNHVVTHGIPNDSILVEGDIVNIDVTSILKGYHGDCSRMFTVGKVSDVAQNICKSAHEALWAGINAVKIGGYFSDIGNAIQDLMDDRGYSIVQDYCGHGIGRGFHEDPLVLHYAQNKRGPRIEVGMCFTIEPMINEGSHHVKTLKDKWTVVTVDGKLSAQEEHTLAITEAGVEVLTLPPQF
jgi:methionyl aminopeptidase